MAHLRHYVDVQNAAGKENTEAQKKRLQKNLQLKISMNAPGQHSYHKPEHQTLPGVSLLIALGLVTAIVLFGILVSTLIVNSIRQSANINRANEAYYAAEGGLEKGLLENQKHGAGYSLTPQDFTYNDGANNPASTIKTVYQIQGQVPADTSYGGDSDYAGMFSVPTPGTGNVAPNCDPLKAVTNGVVSYDGIDYPTADPADHPCNWNRINVGETVTIPLYYTDSTGQAVNLFTPQNASTAQLFVRIRTACENNAVMCDKADRMELDWFSDGDPNTSYNDAIVNWQISGNNAITGQLLILEPRIIYDNFGNFNNQSTIIIETKINAAQQAGHFKVLDLDKGGIDQNSCIGKIIHFLINANTSLSPSCIANFPWLSHQLEKPVLKFTVINSIKESPSSTIPYLEYQIIMNINGTTPTDSSQIVIAEGFSGSFKQVLQVQQEQASGLLEYVIQQ